MVDVVARCPTGALRTHPRASVPHEQPATPTEVTCARGSRSSCEATCTSQSRPGSTSTRPAPPSAHAALRRTRPTATAAGRARSGLRKRERHSGDSPLSGAGALADDRQRGRATRRLRATPPIRPPTQRRARPRSNHEPDAVTEHNNLGQGPLVVPGDELHPRAPCEAFSLLSARSRCPPLPPARPRSPSTPVASSCSARASSASRRSPTTSTRARTGTRRPAGACTSIARPMPANTKGVHIDPAQWNRNDGFSPGITIVVRVPGPRQRGGVQAHRPRPDRGARPLPRRATARRRDRHRDRQALADLGRARLQRGERRAAQPRDPPGQELPRGPPLHRRLARTAHAQRQRC